METPRPIDILAVDDKAENLTALRAILAHPALNLVCVPSGREALKRLLQQDFALILLDVNMPLMDGFETATLIRKRPRSEHTPIIFVTAHVDETHVARGYSLGAVDYITTPLVPEILRAKVAVFVELFRKTAEVRRQSETLMQHAAQLRKLNEASLAINVAGSFEGIVEIVAERGRLLVGALDAEVEVAVDRRRTCRAASRAEEVVPEPAARCSAPLTAPDGAEIGRVQLIGKRDGEFTREDAAMISQLAQMASVAIQNMLYSEERQTNLLKDEFLAIVSHELRTPLSTMLTWAQMLREGKLDAAGTKRGVEVIERNARAQAQLIDDLLDMSRIMAGKVRLELQTVDLRKPITAALESLRPAAQAKSIELACSLPQTPVGVSGDRGRLQQVLSNLLGNAIKFTPRGGRIAVRLEQVRDHAEIAVSDTGQGINPAFLPHVFDRFRQADSSTTRTHGGLGLGLAIVRQLVELHGGRIRAESAGEGKGATFIATLPLGEGEELPAALEVPASAAEASTSHAEARALEGLRILLVEDEPDAREAIALLLRYAGGVVRTAASASAALAEAREWLPDVMVSDIGLPVEDGYALVRQIHALASERSVSIPAVALTAYAQPLDRARALAAGYQTHVTKPVDREELVTALARLRENAGPCAAPAASSQSP